MSPKMVIDLTQDSDSEEQVSPPGGPILLVPRHARRRTSLKNQKNNYHYVIPAPQK